MDKIDCVYYINLDHRTDRKEEIEKELDAMDLLSKSIRIPGVSRPELGILGCVYAHINALNTFLKSEHKNCIILEDDFIFQIDKDYVDFLFSAVFTNDIQFDCILLAGNIFESQEDTWPFLRKVMDAQTTSGYLVSREYAPTLLDNFKESACLLSDYFQEHGKKNHDYSLDIYWKKLQPQSNWFVMNPK
jgi:GR25 family glycosyltransferase involved in LPS biosynthesis